MKEVFNKNVPRLSTCVMDQLFNADSSDLFDSRSRTIALLILLTSCLILTVRWTAKCRRSAANVGQRLPGPPSLPVFGSYPFITLPYRRWLAEGTRQYGEIFAFKLAGQYWVSLNSFRAINVLRDYSEELSGRPQGLWSKKLFNGNGLALGEGSAWRKHRKFVLRFIQGIRWHQDDLESIVQEELHLNLHELNTNGPVSSELFSQITANTVYRIIFGHRAFSNKEFSDRLAAVQTIVHKDIYSTFSTAVMLPYLLAFPNLLFCLVKKTRNAQRSINMLLSFIEEQIRKTSAEPGSGGCQPTFFVEAAIKDRELTGLQKKGEGSLAVTIFDFLIGATDTTSSCLKWIFLYLATYKDGNYQEEVAKELYDLTGSRQVTFTDCQQSQLLLALVTEVMRFHPPLPTAINHRAKTDVSVLGYRIPAGAWVFPNLRDAHRNTDLFGESPGEFNPRRFLTGPDGRFQLPSSVIPFSVGKRSCPGERLARIQISLVAAELLRRYRFRLADENNSSIKLANLMQDSEGLVWSPKAYKLILEPR